ncbi:PAS domain S-box protein [Bradyrhizobium sp.]|uniref:sensor domain-containing diguanylate cyclase n=1 Tax=Bradyrhizobium sp. TaxID=376 RepID=UPI002D6DAE5D|nr:PAS domain S-box protein [Bradyrhizobium sp.]HZR76130.1 PAS domain S-box protein [Bradyrhizobium sp.]
MQPPTAMADDADFEARVRLEVQRRMAATPAMLHSIDAEGRLISVSDAWLAKLGYVREEVLGRRSSEFLTPASRDHAVKNVLPAFFRTGHCDSVEYQMVCKDGRVIDVLLSAVLHRDPSGQEQTSLAVITDVTAMKDAERRVAESEARYRLLADNSTDIIALLDRDGARRYVSPACFAMTGYTPEEMQASRTAETTHPDDVARVLHDLANMTGVTTVTYRMLCKDGRYIWVETTCRPLVGEGQTNLRLCIVRNVDARVRTERQLQESEGRYRFLADNSTDLIMLVGHRGKRSYVSPACEKLLGYTPEEMLEINSADALHPDDRASTMRTLAHGSGDPAQREQTLSYRMRRKDGSYVWVEATGRAVDVVGETDQRLLIVRDIERRMEAERQLKESEARYRLLADNATDVIMTVAQDGKRSYVSPACEKLLGYTPEEMLPINSLDTVHPEDVSTVHRMLAAGSEGGDQQQTYTYRIRHKDGNYIWVETTARDIAGEEGRRQLSIRDIAKRKKAEQQLKDSEARYRLLADNSTDMVFQLDTDLVRRYVSPACRELLGYEPEEMVGIKPADMAHPEDAPRLALVFQMLLSGQTDRHSIVNRIRHRNGNWIWVEAQLRALKGPDGTARAIIGALRDISVRKAVEDELAEANRRLRLLAGQDSLTGLANRRAFDEALAREHLRSRRDKTELGLIMIDVDHFKRFNDLYGHLAGDDCLRCVGATIGGALLRPGDLAARYGGEEFAVLLPDTDEAGAAVTADRIRETIRGLGMRHDANLHEVVTISAGVASFNCADIESDRLIEAADRALYCAKDAGRNTVARASAAGRKSRHSRRLNIRALVAVAAGLGAG